MTLLHRTAMINKKKATQHHHLKSAFTCGTRIYSRERESLRRGCRSENMPTEATPPPPQLPFLLIFVITQCERPMLYTVTQRRK